MLISLLKMKDNGVLSITLILKTSKRLLFILSSKTKLQKFYISLMFCTETLQFTLYSSDRALFTKTSLAELTIYPFALVTDVTVKPILRTNGETFLWMQNHNSQLFRFQMTKSQIMMVQTVVQFKGSIKNSMESKNFQSKDGSN